MLKAHFLAGREIGQASTDRHQAIQIVHKGVNFSMVIDRRVEYITDVESVRNGTATHDGKQVLATDDIRIATKRILRTLSSNPDLALVSGLGLSIIGSHRHYRRISVLELKELVLEQFVLVRPEVGNGGRTRFRVLCDPPPFWLPTLLQGRWIDDEVQSWFKTVEQPTVIQRS